MVPCGRVRAILCEGGQRVEEVVESPSLEILKTQVAMVPHNLL